ncbi:hypothetical protein RF55_9011 [Lasius niger]|uniref:Retrotransposon gag domain-containing protein n=1 Tax=Lasius niger TaxID=67767 RepID=A0A0J7KLQ9_LASNI|nr:hypothetical protein RF55_9011 [Lasius niger]
MEYRSQLDFKIGVDDWEQFIERIDLYFMANDITNEAKKRAILLTNVSAETYAAIRKVCAPKKPAETALADIVEKMTQYVKPKVSVQVLRDRVRQRVQLENETVGQYIAALQELSRDCKFDNVGETVKDQFLNGIRDRNIKVALFREENLTLATATTIAAAYEVADRSVDEIKTPEREERKEASEDSNEVNRLGSSKTYQQKYAKPRGRQRDERKKDSSKITAATKTITGRSLGAAGRKNIMLETVGIKRESVITVVREDI